MSGVREKSRRASRAVALCALLAALGTALMALGGLIPIATYCSPLVASVLLLPVLSELDARWAWMTWAVTAALSLMLSIDREAAFFYLFIGCWPILQPYFDAIRSAPLRFVCKLAYFALALGAMYALLLWVFQLSALLEDFGDFTRWMGVLFYCGLVGVLLLYDLALGRLWLYWLHVLRPRIMKARH